MELETTAELPQSERKNRFTTLHTVTPLSKYLALALFVVMPFVGGYIGYQYAPHKVIEIEKVVFNENDKQPSGETSLAYRPIATTTVDMVSYRIHYTNNAVELLNGPDVVQSIPWDTTFRKIYTDNESLLITNFDINYDHYLDVAILSSIGYGGVNRYYDFYTFNPENYRLERVTDFDAFESDISNVVNPTLNIAERKLTSSFKSGLEWRYIKYQFDGDSYILSEEWTESWDEPESKIEQLLRAPSAVLVVCETQDVLMCFGSGRQPAPGLSTQMYKVYELVSDEREVRYGLINTTSGELSILVLSTDDLVNDMEATTSQSVLSSSSTELECTADSECVVVLPDCEDCEFTAISIDELNNSEVEKKNRCEINPPQFMCDVVFGGKVKCIDNTCQLIE